MSIKLLLLVVVMLIIAYLAGLSFSTRQHRLKPENERHLSHCPEKPNCVFSRSDQQMHAIPAFVLLQGNISLSWEKLIAVIQQGGGEILVNDGRYCHAVFTSGVFRFKDDFEAELNEARIDVRSASRAGTSDLGQNRKRVENIRRLYESGTTLQK